MALRIVQAACPLRRARTGARCAVGSEAMARDPSAKELRAVAPLVTASDALTLVGTCTLATNGCQTVAFSSAELLRRAGESLAICLTLDGKRVVKVSSWFMGRVAGMGILELA